jgi:hypothetical protein
VVNVWRGRRPSAPDVTRRPSVFLQPPSGPGPQARHGSFAAPRTKDKADSDDDTNYSVSTVNTTPMSTNLRQGVPRQAGPGRRSSYGSDVSDLSPPFISPPFISSPAPGRRRSSAANNAGLGSPMPSMRMPDSEQKEHKQASAIGSAIDDTKDTKDTKAAKSEVVRFEKLGRRKSFAMAMAYDAHNERHPKPMQDILEVW